MKYLIVGLGNIGDKYVRTRHNIGFQVIDNFIDPEKESFKLERHANILQKKFKGRTLVLCKPTTYMNLSGKAVNYWLQQEKIPIENMLVIVDDLALPFGTIRIKKQGSDAGHNGLIDIIETFGHQNFNRMRFGIGEESDHTLEEVGRDFNVTRERIRQIEAKALRKLRHPSRSRKLKSFLEK